VRLPKHVPAVGRVLGYWKAERRTIRHGLISLVATSIAEVGAGIALGAITHTLAKLPGLLILLPAANSIRGSIFGAMSSRLGTSMHTGMFEPERRRNTLYQNLYSATILTFSVSILMGVLAKVVGAVLGVRVIGVVDLVVISVLGGVLSSVFVGAFAVVLALAANTHGWDLDSVSAAAVTAIGDVLTIPAIFVATFAAGLRWITPSIFGMLVAVTVGVTLRGLFSKLPEARRALRESLPILVATGCLSLAAGVVVEARVGRFITFPAFLVLIPPLLSDTGALAATLSSRLASKLHLGALEPRAFPPGVALLDTSIVLLFGLWVFGLVAVCAHFAATAVGLASPGLGRMLEVGVVAGVLATVVLVVLAYYTAVATYRLGLDPDNHGVPIVTCGSDLAAILALTIALLIFGLA
jgi:mgtE-like transporter